MSNLKIKLDVDPSGSLSTKSHHYTLSSTGTTRSHAVVDKEGRHPMAGPGAIDAMSMAQDNMRTEGGEEMMGGMRLMVPRSRKQGKLFVGEL
jgi:hypothetical protein